MQDLLSRLKNLHRPRLLVRTARIGASSYSRDRDLRRIFGYAKPPRSAAAILRLLDYEHELNQQRLGGDAGYTITRHVELLIALVAEAEYLATSPRRDISQETPVQTGNSFPN